jgi:hypothetical protein
MRVSRHIYLGVLPWALFNIALLVYLHIDTNPSSNAVSATRQQTSKLRCDNPVVDFGRIYRPTGIISHTFIVFNASDSMQKVRVLRSSCGCTKVIV